MADLKDMLEAKTQYAEGLEEEVVEQYVGGFDKALKQVTFLYAQLDVSSYDYFKEIRDGQLVDKSFLGANAAMGTQLKAPMNAFPLGDQDEEQVGDSPTTS